VTVGTIRAMATQVQRWMAVVLMGAADTGATIVLRNNG